MPYIKKYERQKYKFFLDNIKEILMQQSNEKLAGELNYLMLEIALGGAR